MLGFSARSAPLWLLLFITLLVSGCGDSQEYVYTSNGGAPGTGNTLRVSLDQANAGGQVQAQSTDAVARVRFEVTTPNDELVATLTVARNAVAEFEGLPSGTYLVRALGLDNAGAILGYFDLVVDLSTNLDVVIPGLRNDATPPAVAFPEAGTGISFFLFTSTPAQVQAGEVFAVSAQAYDPPRVARVETVANVSLTSNGVAFSAVPAARSTDANGSVRFEGLSFSSGSSGATFLTLQAQGFEASVSRLVRVVSLGSPSLSFVSFPTSAIATEALAPNVTVEVRDAAGNRVTSPVSVTLQVQAPGSASVLNGTTTVTTVNGLAAFPDLAFNQPGTFTLVATAASYTSATSPSLTVTPNIPNLVFTQTPETALENENFSPDVTVELRGADGDLLPVNTSVTLTLADPGNAALQGNTTVNAVSGVATFPDLSISRRGTYALQAAAVGFPNATSDNIIITSASLDAASVSSSGERGNAQSQQPALSSDGRFMAFQSQASNLVPNDTNDAPDIFVHDRVTGEIERVSISSTGAQADGGSGGPDISGDGRFVVFDSEATNLAAGDSNGEVDLFIHDRQTGETVLLSVDENGQPVVSVTSDVAENPSISADGGAVVFSADAGLVAADTNGNNDIYVREFSVGPGGIVLGALELVSRPEGGGQASSSSYECSISADGTRVAFESRANLKAPHTNSQRNIYLYDRATEALTLVSKSPDGQSAANDFTDEPAISADGEWIIFYSEANNLTSSVVGAIGTAQVYLYDVENDSIELLSADSNGIAGNGESESRAISGDGRFIVINTEATNLLSSDDNGDEGDVIVIDRTTGERRRLSQNADGVQADASSGMQDISDDGRFVAFVSAATNLVPGGTGVREIYLTLNSLFE